MTNNAVFEKTENIILDLKQFKRAMSTYKEEEDIVDFSVFRKCFTAGRGDWTGRAYAFLGYVSYLFWEEVLFNRILLDTEGIGGYHYKYEMILAENDQEQCRAKALYYLAKALRSGCALNSELRSNLGKCFITRKIKRSDEIGPYNYSLEDSIQFVHNFATVFDKCWGGSGIRDVRWDIKLREHKMAEMGARLQTAVA